MLILKDLTELKSSRMLGLIYGAADELIQAPTAWEKQKRQREAGVEGNTQLSTKALYLKARANQEQKRRGEARIKE